MAQVNTFTCSVDYKVDYKGEKLIHSALKLEKSAISKVQKTIICIFKNAQEQNSKLPKMQFLDFFLVQKLIFCKAF